MVYQFAFETYQRQFLTPLKTAHGLWRTRLGIIVYLRDDQGRIGRGEIAPIPWFGTETMEAAIALCQSLPDRICRADITQITESLPCCQFGLGCALEQLRKPSPNPAFLPPPNKICGLLPTGKSALDQWEALWEQGHRTFKWKIGVADPKAEISLLWQLVKTLPQTAKLRLDANGGLCESEAHQWLEQCDRVQPKIEYLEQPLAPDKVVEMQSLSLQYQTAIALDESVATPTQWQSCIDQEWSGIYVIKPALAGFPEALEQRCQHLPNAIVFSSVFETDIGRTASLELAQTLSTPGFALGFGIDHWLEPSPKVSMSNSIFS